MLGDQLAAHHDVGAGRADVRRGTLVAAVAAEELDLDRDGEVLVLPHALGRLPVDHDAAVPERPARPAGALLADEPVLDPQPVVRERRLVEEVAELARRTWCTCRTRPSARRPRPGRYRRSSRPRHSP